MALLLSGSVRVYKIGESGREITLYRLGPGRSCILTASCIVNDLAFPAHAMVEENVEALVVPAPVFQDWVSRHEVWRKYVFALASQRLANVIMLIEEVAFGRMDKRLADYLSAAATAAEGDPPVLKTTHEAIAADLGSSREVVSRLLKDLEVRGVVKLARGTITVLQPPGRAAFELKPAPW
jgi:CRP/FNR family transcriptional regulator